MMIRLLLHLAVVIGLSVPAAAFLTTKAIPKDVHHRHLPHHRHNAPRLHPRHYQSALIIAADAEGKGEEQVSYNA